MDQIREISLSFLFLFRVVLIQILLNNIGIFLQSSYLLTNAYEPGWGGGVVGCPPSPKFGQLRFFGQGEEFGEAKSAHVYVRVFFFCSKRGIFHFVYVIAWARGQLRILFSRVFSTFPQNCPSREATRAIWKTLKIQVKLILNCPKALAITCLSHQGQNYRGLR